MEVYKFIRQGLSHKKRNIECQDCLSYKYLEDGTLILGLSDGAGSAKYAKEASTSNVNAIIRFFSKNSVEDFIELEKEEQINQILSYCFNELSESAKAIGDLNVREYSATLLFTVIKENTIIYGHIGDGAIYAVDKEYKCCYFSEPENKDSSRKTYFTVSQNASEHLYIDVMTGVDELPGMIVMMSDGPQMMFKDRGFGNPAETAMEMAPFIIEHQIRNDEELESLLNQMTELEIEKMDDWSFFAVDLFGNNADKTIR